MINFPFKHLKEVDIDGDTDEQGESGGSSTPLTKFDTIKNYINLLYQDYNIEFDIEEETSTQEIEVEDENENLTGEVVTATRKIYKFVPKTEVPRVYLSGDTTGSISTGAGQLQLHSQNVYGSNSENSISKIIFNDAELTINQLKSYDVIQVGVSNITINDVNVRQSSYETYLEWLNWFRNNVAEFVEVPILLLGQPASGNTKMYINSGLIQIQLYLNDNVGIYTQTVYGAIEEEQKG